MRCPHCAAPHAGDVCRTCGLPVTAPAEQPRLEALELTRVDPVEVEAQRLPDLLTTHDEFGDVGIPDDGAAPAGEARPTHCRRCGTAAGTSRLCEQCGFALYTAKPPAAEAVTTQRCGACGVPNRVGQARCVACGQAL